MTYMSEQNPKLLEEIRKLREDISEIRMAVAGDTKLGIEGLPKRIKKLENWRHSIDMRVAYTAGVVSALSFGGLEGLKMIVDHLLHHP